MASCARTRLARTWLLERVTQTIVKRYNAEIHSQSAIEGILELREREQFSPSSVEQVEVEIFDVAYRIIGGGEEGDKTTVETKEAADHSLPYLIAVALLDGQVMRRSSCPIESIARMCSVCCTAFESAPPPI